MSVKIVRVKMLGQYHQMRFYENNNERRKNDSRSYIIYTDFRCNNFNFNVFLF